MDVRSWSKKAASFLPGSWQRAIRRFQYRQQIRCNLFYSNEPEFTLVQNYLKLGDCVIDVGANIGTYTKRFSDLVGGGGRVVAFEPIPETFALLVGNMELLTNQNVTLLNVAASDQTRLIGMEVPRFNTGLRDFYSASISDRATDFHVMAIPLDSLALPKVSLLKIDAEGHDREVLLGAMQLISRDLPVLIIESVSSDIELALTRLKYQSFTLPGSPNRVFLVSKEGAR